MFKLNFIKPVSDKISSDFASRKGTHSGIDYESIMNTEIKASEGGVVVRKTYIHSLRAPE